MAQRMLEKLSLSSSASTTDPPHLANLADVDHPLPPTASSSQGAVNVSHLLHSVRGPPAVPHQTQDNPTSTANSSTPAVVHGPPREQNAGSQRVAESQVYSLTQLYALPSHTNPMPKKHFMKPADIKFVVSRVLQPLETMDPFHDDYYYLQYLMQKNRATHKPIANVPTPLWKDAKERVLREMVNVQTQLSHKNAHLDDDDEASSAGLVGTSVSGNNLGTIVKSDIFRPREMISMGALKEQDLFDEYGDSISSSLKTPFQSRLWSVRGAIQRGYDALFTVQELQHILGAYSEQGVQTNMYVEILSEMEKAVKLLCHAIGITSVTKQQQSSSNVAVEVILDSALLSALVQAAKGKKLLARSMNYLNPAQRWAIIPSIVCKLLQVDVATQSTEDALVEARLLKLIADFIEHSRQYQAEQHFKAAQANLPVAAFSVELLDNLRKCLKVIMVSFTQKSVLKKSLRSSRERASAVNGIVEAGSAVGLQVGSGARDEWMAVKDAFLVTLEGA